MMNNRKKWFGGACVALALTAGGVVAGAGADGSGPAPEAETVDGSAPPVQTIEPEQGRKIAQLRRSRVSDDALPAGWRDQLRDGGRWGTNTSLSRRVAPGVWIVPADGYVCLANVTPGDGGLNLGCATPEDVDRGLLAPSDVDAQGNGVLTGVVPDGVGEVTLIDRDGSTRTADVDRNTYRAAIDANLKEVRFTGADGAERTLPMAWNG
jgi:hypothetical protein